MRRSLSRCGLSWLFAGLAAVVVSGSVVVLLQAGWAQAQAEAVYRTREASLTQLFEVAREYGAFTSIVKRVLSDSVAPAAALNDSVIERGRLNTAWLDYRDSQLLSSDRALIESARPLLASASQAIQRIQQLLRTGDVKGLGDYSRTDEYRSLAQLRKGLRSYARDQGFHALLVSMAANERYAQACWLAGIFIYLVLAVTILSTCLLRRANSQEKANNAVCAAGYKSAAG